MDIVKRFYDVLPPGDREPEAADAELQLPAPPPPSYLRWVPQAHAVDRLDFGCFRLDTQLEDPGDDEPFELGLIPFGSDGNDAGPLCFDTAVPRPDKEWPIVVWDHDHREKSAIICSSFEKLLELAISLTEYERDGALQEFIELDPTGGGTEAGFEHWNNFTDNALVPTLEMRLRWAGESPADDFHAQRTLTRNAEAFIDEGGACDDALKMLARVSHPGLAAARARAEVAALAAAGRGDELVSCVQELAERWLQPSTEPVGLQTDLSGYELRDLLVQNPGPASAALLARVEATLPPEEA